MLRDPNVRDQPPGPARRRLPAVAALAAAGLLIAGLRPPLADRASAQAVAPAPTQVEAGPAGPATAAIDPRTLGPEVAFVVDFRPRSMLQHGEIRKLAEQFPANGFDEFRAIASGKIEQVLVLGTVAGGRPAWKMLVRSAQPYNWDEFTSARGQQLREREVTYRRMNNGPTPTCFRVLDPRTLLSCHEDEIAKSPLDPGRPGTRHDWDAAWAKPGNPTLRVACDRTWPVRSILAETLRPGPVEMQMIAPVIDGTATLSASLDVADGLVLDAAAASAAPDQARRVADTVRAILTLGQNAMPTLRQAAGQGPPEGGQLRVDAADAVAKLLGSARVEQDGSTTRLSARADSIAPIVALLAPASMASREAAKRSQSVNNLKQIGLAMHNWASIQPGEPRFPPAVLYGPDGKTPHSWRVALLPFLEQKALYDQYKFDEPWDGPNNRKLIERMPAVFHDPGDDEAKPGQTSYFAPTGAMTLFPDRPLGMLMREVTDGTSNTIMAVEARRPIFWTEPSDIPIPPDGPLPAFGENHPGGFNALIADGSVRFIKDTINQIVLRALFSANGGEVIGADAANPRNP